MGVRWITVADELGRGLRFAAEGVPFESSVLPCSAYELDAASHREELPKPHYTWLRIMGCQMGVGGDDSWGAPVHEEFRIPAAIPMELHFTISSIK